MPVIDCSPTGPCHALVSRHGCNVVRIESIRHVLRLVPYEGRDDTLVEAIEPGIVTPYQESEDSRTAGS